MYFSGRFQFFFNSTSSTKLKVTSLPSRDFVGGSSNKVHISFFRQELKLK